MREPLFTRRFVTLWLFQFATFFSAFQLFPVIPLRIMELGGSKAAAGSFLFVYTLASATAAPVMGTIADHFGRKRMLILASILFVFFSLAYGVVPWLPLLLLIAVIHGAIWSSILASASAIMTDFIPASRRNEGLAYWGLATTSAISIAPAVGLLVHHYGWFVLCAELALMSALTALWAVRIPVISEPQQVRGFPPLSELWDWTVVKATLALAVLNIGYGGITSYVAILARERHITPESLFFTVFAGAIVVVRVFTSRLGDRFGPKVLLYPSFIATPLSFALLAFAQTRTQLIAAAILFGLGIGASFPAFMTFVVTNTEARSRGRTFGSVIWAVDTGIGLGSLTIGAIGQRYGLRDAFLFAAAIGCLSIPIFVTTSRRLARGTPVARDPEHAGTN
ncbi:MAG TPA: MFS transporter [Thermoanaerobaculia bacterium]